MKRFFLSIFFLLLVAPVFSQVKNFNYFKLCVLNEKGEVLLVNFKDMWEPAGRKYDSPETMQTVLKQMAKEMGVEVGRLKLRAMIGKYYGDAKYPIMFNYVTAQYKSGELVIPPGCKDIKWYTPEEALKIIPFDGMKMVLEKVFQDDSTLWAGALNITKVPNSTKKLASVREKFYKY
ncbi:MAG: NUDIX hydrolase [Cyclobacteriaceae bacterium]